MLKPNQEERHRIDWELKSLEADLRHEEDNLANVKDEVERINHAIHERGITIGSILKDQTSDRIKVQRLLALCQPVTRDITVLFDHFSPPTHTHVDRRTPLDTITNEVPVSPSARQHAGASGRNKRRLPTSKRPAPASMPAALRSRAYESFLIQKTAVLEQRAQEVERLGREVIERLGSTSERRAVDQERREEATRVTIRNLKNAVAEAQAKEKKALAEYLTLRHNIKTAHEASRQEREECIAMQKELQRRREEGRKFAAQQSAALSAEATAQLEEETTQLRVKLAQARAAGEKVYAEQLEARRAAEHEIEELTESVLRAKREYAHLEHSRGKTLPGLSLAVSELREMVTTAESSAMLRTLGMY